MILAEENLPCRFVNHDRDSTFTAFDPIASSEGITIVKTPFRCPLGNAFAERHVREIRETLNHLILLGEWHPRHVLKSIEVHHNTRRPHQGIGNVIAVAFGYPMNPVSPEQVHCDSVLGCPPEPLPYNTSRLNWPERPIVILGFGLATVGLCLGLYRSPASGPFQAPADPLAGLGEAAALGAR